jgi:hypothetical protein
MTHYIIGSRCGPHTGLVMGRWVLYTFAPFVWADHLEYVHANRLFEA